MAGLPSSSNATAKQPGASASSSSTASLQSGDPASSHITAPVWPCVQTLSNSAAVKSSSTSRPLSVPPQTPSGGAGVSSTYMLLLQFRRKTHLHELLTSQQQHMLSECVKLGLSGGDYRRKIHQRERDAWDELLGICKALSDQPSNAQTQVRSKGQDMRCGSRAQRNESRSRSRGGH